MSMVLASYGGNMLLSNITRTCIHIARAAPGKCVTRRGCWSFSFMSSVRGQICPCLEGCNCKDVCKETGEKANGLEQSNNNNETSGYKLFQNGKVMLRNKYSIVEGPAIMGV